VGERRNPPGEVTEAETGAMGTLRTSKPAWGEGETEIAKKIFQGGVDLICENILREPKEKFKKKVVTFGPAKRRPGKKKPEAKKTLMGGAGQIDLFGGGTRERL